ncbi:hypothetical protein PSH03_005395 [Micromonospora sp. PSH03]|uniref:hypothetical protein n=1 Tax=Micromonospora salmantinae TaxID=2911211 RepID=UPI001EE7F3FA|nr:hypothetical protein [Micromonospora salmantinae]MCG5459612.1 hypothetical protein [Micromonospora salmantinae]
MKIRKVSELSIIQRTWEITDGSEVVVQWAMKLVQGQRVPLLKITPKIVEATFTNGVITRIGVRGDVINYENGEVRSRETDIGLQWGDIDSAPVWFHGFSFIEGHPREGQ